MVLHFRGPPNFQFITDRTVRLGCLDGDRDGKGDPNNFFVSHGSPNTLTRHRTLADSNI